ncbi:MAG: flavodoxin [Clostridia bacterium]|nr:flavodoxin [Clostridia bacterium]
MKHTRHILSALIALVMILTLAACAGGGQTSGTVAETESRIENTTAPSGKTGSDALSRTDETAAPSESKTLVVYFSRTGEQYTVGVIDKGNTAIVAEMIAEKTGADLWEVLPVDDHYPMTYSALTDIAKKEQNDKARPAYKGTVPDLSEYDTVFIGAPVWWGDWPMIMYTFFEQNRDALAGKTLIPFSTHEGSGLSGFDKKLAYAIPGATVGKGLAIRGNDAQNSQDSVRESVNGWLKDLGF